MSEFKRFQNFMENFFNQKELKQERKYYKYRQIFNASYISCDNEAFYNIDTNEFVTSLNKEECFINEISKEEYYSLLNNKHCNCKIGAGHDILIHIRYDIVEEFNKRYFDYYAEFFVDKIYKNCYMYIWKNKCLDHPIKCVNSKEFRLYYKKACLQCETCLDDIKELESKFKEIISEIENGEKRRQMVLDICGE